MPLVLRFPSEKDNESLPDWFSEFFLNKIIKILSIISSQSDLSALASAKKQLFPGKNSELLTQFAHATDAEIKKFITTSSSASCKLYPLPTSVVKECTDEIISMLTRIVNASLTEGVVPNSMKNAIVKPLIKKANLDPEILKNFRPVTNLSFLSKMIEKVVAARLTDHLTKHKLMKTMQSAYRQFRSTETALLRVQNDLLSALNQKKMVALVLIDLSAAHPPQTIINRLTSYLSTRSQLVSIDGVNSDKNNLLFSSWS